MPSLPASQPAEDGEADGATAPPTVDPFSEEPLPHRDGVRKSVDPPSGPWSNASPVILRLCYNTLFSTVALSRLFDCYMTKYTIMLTAAPGSLS